MSSQQYHASITGAANAGPEWFSGEKNSFLAASLFRF